MKATLLDVHHHNAPVAHASALLLRSAAAESPRLRWKSVLSAEADTAHWAELVRAELETDEDWEQEIALEPSERRRRSTRELGAIESPFPALRHRGVYLVTGGFGGIGRAIVPRLLEDYRATVVVVGRRQLEHVRAELGSMAASGRNLRYRAADISDRDALEAIVADVMREHGELNGVLHLAGTISDGLAVGKMSRDVERVLAAKVRGTAALDEATARIALDFFVAISSIVGTRGNIGQSDYAFANAFMDEYMMEREAHRRTGRRFGRSLSLALPLVSGLGMGASDEVQRAYAARFAEAPLDGGQVFDAIVAGLALEQPVVEVALAERLPAGNHAAPPKGRATGRAEAPWSMAEPRSAGVKRDDAGAIETYVRAEVAKLLKISEDSISAKDTLRDAGVDSIGFIDLAARMERELSISVSPMVFYDHPTFAGLAGVLAKELHARGREHTSPGASFPGAAE